MGRILILIDVQALNCIVFIIVGSLDGWDKLLFCENRLLSIPQLVDFEQGLGCFELE